MSDKKTDTEPSLAELQADLDQRRKDHVFMTTEEARAWNAQIGKTSQSHKHWMTQRRAEEALEDYQQRVRTERQQRLQFLASGWKRLAKEQAWQLGAFHNEKP